MTATVHQEFQVIDDGFLNITFVDIYVVHTCSIAKLQRYIRKHPEKYGIKHFVKFGDYNVGRDGDLLTLPAYMQFLLDLEPEEVILETLDTDELTRMAREFLDQK